MWQWILIIFSTFFVLAIVEETIQFFVNRYINGPYLFESKLKAIMHRIKGKVKKKSSTSE